VHCTAKVCKVPIHKQIFLTLLLLLLSACQAEESQETPTTAPARETPAAPEATETPEPPVSGPGPGEPFTLGIGESQTVAQISLNVTFANVVSDSRCPTEVDCVQDGPVIILVLAQQGDNPVESFEMNPEAAKAALTGIPPNIISYQGFEIELTAVDPFPRQPEDLQNLDDYTATFIVR
jgi:hypothetical protein